MSMQNSLKKLIDEIYADEPARNLARYILSPLAASEFIATYPDTKPLGEDYREAAGMAVVGVVGLTAGLASNPLWQRFNGYLSAVIVQANQSMMATSAYLEHDKPREDTARQYERGLLNGRLAIIEIAVAIRYAELNGAIVPGKEVRNIRERFSEVLDNGWNS